MLNSVKMVEPNPNDKNRWRWPTTKLWQHTQKIISDCFTESIQGQLPGRILEVCKIQKIKDMRDLYLGVICSKASLHGLEIDEVEAIKELVGKELEPI